jgi:hypothetical protein
MGLDDQMSETPHLYPESRFVPPRKDAQKRSMARAAIIGDVALTAFGPAWLNSKRQ